MKINGLGSGYYTDCYHERPGAGHGLDDGGGFGNGYGSSYGGGFGNGAGNNYANGTGFGSGFGRPASFYRMTPFACLTFRGRPHSNAFENFSLHLQVEQLVHRRV